MQKNKGLFAVLAFLWEASYMTCGAGRVTAGTQRISEAIREHSFVQPEVKCFHPLNERSIARTYATHTGVKDAAACQELCAKESQCTHFNYNTESRSCELKIKNGSDVVAAPNVITGPKTCNTSCFTFGVGHTASEMARAEKKYSPFDCQSWCRDTIGCEYFTYNLNSSTCFLKGANAVGTERQYPGDMVGPKEFCSGGVEEETGEEAPQEKDAADGETQVSPAPRPEEQPGVEAGPSEQPSVPGLSPPDADHEKEELPPPVHRPGEGAEDQENRLPGQGAHPAAIPDTGLSSGLLCIHPHNKTSNAPIHKTIPDTRTPEDCHLLCWHDDQCTHFTYDFKSSRCDVRSGDSSNVSDAAHHVTGPKTCNASCFTIGQGHTAPEIVAAQNRYSAFDCQNWCRNTKGCMYFTYNTKGKKCFLKGANAHNTLRAYPDDLAGPRDYCPS
ncbi:PAN domain-containing protein [Besnoitia besnoiti]|uniref:PAN domain-containing protein n=1 Tax=Besnoitia besnoiti TaxID=94643 RepID=A0A2A9M947_BESBE|nr:PAN domain-containing protein [Besnoitia besnoiti]PFH31912.1 PAN domain-containing protein [Besnoitia besnoiti]